MVSWVMFQIFYGLLGSWTAYLIGVLYVEYRTRKGKEEKVEFTNHVIQLIIYLISLITNVFEIYSEIIFRGLKSWTGFWVGTGRRWD